MLMTLEDFQDIATSNFYFHWRNIESGIERCNMCLNLFDGEAVDKSVIFLRLGALTANQILQRIERVSEKTRTNKC